MENYQVFISYRRDGGDALAGRIADRLKSLGYCVFFDVESMRSGTFNTQILSAIDRCKDVILVLPPNGLDRCANSEDWVRQEICHAIKQQKNIIPVMMRGFTFPDVLPPELDSIRFLEGVAASNDYFDAVIDRLVSLLESRIENKKIADEILYLSKQYDWAYSVQTSDAGSIFVNYSMTGLKNLPKLRTTVCIFSDDVISIFAQGIPYPAECDKGAAYVLLNELNKKSRYAIFELRESDSGLYIQARCDIFHGISNKAGVCVQMLQEVAFAADTAYPEITSATH